MFDQEHSPSQSAAQRKPRARLSNTRHAEKNLRKAERFFCDFLKSYHLEVIRGRGRLGGSYFHSPSQSGFAELLLTDPDWVCKQIDSDRVFTMPMVMGQCQFASVDLGPLTALVDKIENKELAVSELPTPTGLGSIVHFFFLDANADPSLAAQMCQVSQNEFLRVARVIRRHLNFLCFFEAALPLSAVALSDDLVDQINMMRNEFEARLTRAIFLSTHGLPSSQAISLFELPDVTARQYLSYTTPAGRPNIKNIQTHSYFDNLIAAISSVLDLDIQDPKEMLYSVIKFLENETDATVSQCLVRNIGIACARSVIEEAKSQRVRNAASMLSALIHDNSGSKGSTQRKIRYRKKQP